MHICRSKKELEGVLASIAPDSKLGFVPTMGALHEGHLRLVKEAQQRCDAVIASIFVNPTQFGEGEDLARYPRQEEADAALLEAEDVTVLYLPDAGDIYPDGVRADVTPHAMSKVMEGVFRPQFFAGVCTVVKRLFEHVKPDMAFFGEKDFQQLWIIKQMVEEFSLPIGIVAVPTQREVSGLALSSRNQYLTDAERKTARTLYAALKNVVEVVMAEESPPDACCKLAKARLLDVGFEVVDYIEYRREDTLELLDRFQPGGRLFAAAWLGGTRLIDNLAVR